MLAGAMDKAGDWMKFGNPVGRAWNRFFDNRTYGALNESSQRGYFTRGAREFERAMSEGRGAQHDMLEKLEPMLRDPQFKDSERQILSSLQARAEGSPLQFRNPTENAALGGNGAADYLSGHYKDRYTQERLAGLPLEEWKNPEALNYVRRQSVWGERDLLRPRYSLHPNMTSIDLHREPLFNQAGGTERLQDWSLRYSGWRGPARQTERMMFKDLVRDKIDFNAMNGVRTPLTRDELRALKQQSEGLAKLYKTMTPAHVTQQVPLFNPDVVGNMGDYAYQHGRKMAAAQGLYGAMAHEAASPADFIAKGQQYLTAREVLRRMGFETHAADAARGFTEHHGAGVELLKALAPKGAAAVEPLAPDEGSQGDQQSPGSVGGACRQPARLHEELRRVAGERSRSRVRSSSGTRCRICSRRWPIPSGQRATSRTR